MNPSVLSKSTLIIPVPNSLLLISDEKGIEVKEMPGTPFRSSKLKKSWLRK